MSQARLGLVFDSRSNSVNALRLVLAASVIFWHSFPLTGREVRHPPLRQLMGSIWVDGFFAISGFLITGSWLRRPRCGAFLRARLLRIFPAYWVCLLVTAFVLAPTLFAAEVTGAASLKYVVDNALLTQRDYAIAGTPLGVPLDGVWNGSLWTLRWEFLCYLGVLVLGILRLLERRWTVPVIAAVSWLTLSLIVLGPLDGASIPDVTRVLGSLSVEDMSRFVLMFSCGALVHQFADTLPLNWWWVGGAAAVTLTSMFLPDYRLVGAPFLAYTLLALGALITHPRLRLRHDISFGVYIYAFPVQQILATTDWVRLPPLMFGLAATVLTVPIAAASWFGVERPVSRLGRPKRV